jgi:hypothetical protein
VFLNGSKKVKNILNGPKRLKISPFHHHLHMYFYFITIKYVIYYNISFKIFKRTPLCPYLLKQKDQVHYKLNHSFQRLNTSHMIYSNPPFKHLLNTTPFTPEYKALCYPNVFLQPNTIVIWYYKIRFRHILITPFGPYFPKWNGQPFMTSVGISWPRYNISGGSTLLGPWSLNCHGDSFITSNDRASSNRTKGHWCPCKDLEAQIARTGWWV